MDGQGMSAPVHVRSEDDRRMESLMGRLLQIGVLLASVFVLFGGVLYLKDHAGAAVSYRVFVSQTSELRHAKTLLAALRHLRPEAVIQLGVLMLIATPIARVIFAAFAFAMERDRLYLVISLIVLGVLVFGLHTT
jgi:uncharacterized membrane protein